MEKIKLVYICETLSGGVRKHIIDLLNYIDKDKYEVHLIHGESRMDSLFIKFKHKMYDINFYPISEMQREMNIIKDLISYKKVLKILWDIKPDVIHCHSSKAGVIGRLAAKTVRVKKVFYTPHGYIIQNPNISNKKKMFFCLIEKIFAKYFTNKVVHVSKGEEKEAIKHKLVNKKKSTVIYNGMNVPSPQDKVSNETINIVTIARMDEQKNPWDSIKIIEALVKEIPDIKYTFVGDGYFYNDIKKYVKEHGLEKRILLPGFLDNPLNVVKKADIFLLTSLYEGLPYALIEALAYKVPLVVTNVTGNNELVIEEYNGYLFKLGDLEDGKNKMKRLINHLNNSTNMSDNAYAYFLENFTFDKMIKKYDELYSTH
ncbi:glycosyltransferase family 4 protein [Niallia sp. MER TA 168]|uniref:glycosyltransferase family 4 protein n=1 Tax=Niallia sp. MER TA 168 TaxID=2939568 RepID=UPI002041B580|nr:glycosyltransferase family 4 protein [Niallia sp. MER TA 168]MCM3363553.1 glycosyltransferase family 4 protein [Niallia sp. MER TA 168]